MKCDRCKQLESVLRSVVEMLESMPSGYEEDPDPDDRSPDDAVAYITGRIRKMCLEVLR